MRRGLCPNPARGHFPMPWRFQLRCSTFLLGFGRSGNFREATGVARPRLKEVALQQHVDRGMTLQQPYLFPKVVAHQRRARGSFPPGPYPQAGRFRPRMDPQSLPYGLLEGSFPPTLPSRKHCQTERNDAWQWGYVVRTDQGHTARCYFYHYLLAPLLSWGDSSRGARVEPFCC